VGGGGRRGGGCGVQNRCLGYFAAKISLSLMSEEVGNKIKLLDRKSTLCI